MKIINIAKKDRTNVVVHFDNGENLFLAYEVLLKNGLKKNDEISESRFSFLVRENQLHFIKQRSFRYLARRLHSSSELRLKLKAKGYDAALIDEVISDLEQKQIIDDHSFAVMYVEEKSRNKLWGKKKLHAELAKRGVKSQIINEVLDSKLPEGNDFESALKLVEKKVRRLKSKNYENKKLKEKILAYLYSKGYDYETSRNAAESFLKGSK